MYRLIKYYDSIGQGKEGLFSDCSTKYEILDLCPDSCDSETLLVYAMKHGFKVKGLPFVPKTQHGRRNINIVHTVQLAEEHVDTYWNKTEIKPVFLGLVDLSALQGPLSALTGTNNELTSEQALNIVNDQAYGVDSVGEMVDGETIIVKSSWKYYHQIPLLGYSLKSFEKIMGITEHGFSDDTYSCHGCGLYDNEYSGHTYNHRVVNECELLGVRCGCYDEHCQSNNGLDEYIDQHSKCVNLDSAKALEKKGKLKFIERFIGGMVDGRGGHYAGEFIREGDPENILVDLKAKYPKRRYVFSHDESGQFQTYFSIWQVASEGKRFKNR